MATFNILRRRCFIICLMISIILKSSVSTGIATTSTNKNDLIEQRTHNNDAKSSPQYLSLSPRDAAVSMNSLDFLEELVKIKDTVDEKYYGIYDSHDHDMNDKNNEVRGDRNQNGPLMIQDNGSDTNNERLISIVEYTGRLWFMRERGIQFQERVRIKNLSEHGSTIECITKYKRKNEWVDCSRVLCSFQVNNDSQRLKMKVGSEILMRLPLLGAGGAVKRQISKSFEAAAESFFRRLEPISNENKEY